MTKIKLIIGVATLLLIAGLLSALLYLKKENDKHLENIGHLEADISQYKQSIKEQEQENEKLRKRNTIVNDELVTHRKTIINLESRNQNQKYEIGRLKNENAEINDYLNAIVDIDIIRLFRKNPNETYHYNENGICGDTRSVANGNACAVYKTESIVNYALDLEKALDSCNADKAAARDIQEGFISEH